MVGRNRTHPPLSAHSAHIAAMLAHSEIFICTDFLLELLIVLNYDMWLHLAALPVAKTKFTQRN